MSVHVPEKLGDVCVLGLGKTALSVCSYLAGLDASRVKSVTLFGGSDAHAGEKTAELEALGVRVIIGTDDVDGAFDICIASPGIPDSSKLFLSAASCSKEIIGEPEFAYRESPNKWIAITGTNGKTTTTALTTRILQTADEDAVAVGNIGCTITDELAGRQDSEWFVAELSSFQLATIKRLHPRAAALLNITPDHLEWHGSLEAYAAAKERIFENLDPCDLAVISDLDAYCRACGKRLDERGLRVCHVSTQDPKTSCAAFVREGVLVIRRNGHETELVRKDDLKIHGIHNALNALAASALALEVGVDPVSIRHALLDFAPLEHRIEPVKEVSGVLYVNDSKATNTDAVEKSLTSFSGRGVVLLLGGHDKGTDLTQLATAVNRVCKTALCYGAAGKRLAAALATEKEKSASRLDIIEAPHMKDAFDAAVKAAAPGDVVLLSPACSSFDEFSGMAERGRVFKQYVYDLAEREGVLS